MPDLQTELQPASVMDSAPGSIEPVRKSIRVKADGACAKMREQVNAEGGWGGLLSLFAATVEKSS